MFTRQHLEKGLIWFYFKKPREIPRNLDMIVIVILQIFPKLCQHQFGAINNYERQLSKTYETHPMSISREYTI